MSHPVQSLTALRAFEAAARLSSFAKAASELNVSHTVISQHIRNLEDWLEAPLFIRHSNRVELVPEARILALRISEGFQIIGEACDNFRGTFDTTILNVSCEPAFATRWLRKRIAEFHQQHPGIEINLRSEANPPDLKSDGIDVVIHFENLLANDGLRRDRLFPIDAFPASSPDFLAKNKDTIKKDDFFDLPLVHDNGRTVWHQWFNKYAPNSDAWKNSYVYTDLLMAIEAAIDGEGVFLADKIICEKEIDAGTLVKLDDRILRCTWYCIASIDSRPNNHAISNFQSWLQIALTETPFKAGTARI